MQCKLIFFLCLCWLFNAAVTQADPQSGDSREIAKEHFRKGEALADAGQYFEAAKEFLAAYRAEPHPSVLLNIAVCFDTAGDTPSAVEYYRLYVDNADDAKGLQKSRKRLLVLEKRVAELNINCADQACQISVDGDVKGAAPCQVIVMPGVHRVEADSPTASFEVVEQVIRAGDVVAITLRVQAFKNQEQTGTDTAVEPVPTSEPEPQPTAAVEPMPVDDALTTTTSDRMLRTPFWIAAGVTVVAGGSAAAFGIRTKQLKDDFDDSGGTDSSLSERGDRAKIATNILLGVTGAAAATAVGLLIYDLWFAKSRQSESNDTAVMLSPGPDQSLTLVIGKRF